MALRQCVRALVGLVFLVSAGVAQNANAQNWDGAGLLRFGTFLQGSFVDGDFSQTTTTGVIQRSVSPSAFGVGLSFGYDHRFGNFVIGLETDASFDHGGEKDAATAAQFAVDYLVTGRGRLGYYTSNNIMLYGTLGMALLGSEYKQTNFNPGTGVGSSGNKKNATVQGLTYGAGIEYDAHWGIWFLEYLHTDFDTWTFANFSGETITYEPSTDVVRLGLKFKIGHDFGRGGYDRGYGGHTPMK